MKIFEEALTPHSKGEVEITLVLTRKEAQDLVAIIDYVADPPADPTGHSAKLAKRKAKALTKHTNHIPCY